MINGHGDESRALIGDLIGVRAQNLGIGGFVIDGAVRDADALAELGLPVFARGVSPRARTRTGRGAWTCRSPWVGSWYTPGTSSWPMPTAW